MFGEKVKYSEKKTKHGQNVWRKSLTIEKVHEKSHEDKHKSKHNFDYLPRIPIPFLLTACDKQHKMKKRKRFMLKLKNCPTIGT